MKQLDNKGLISDEVANMASVIAQDIRIRKIIKNFQLSCAYIPQQNIQDLF